jgi:predicted phosphodiesterase
MGTETHLYAVVSDIHGNYEALKAVAADAIKVAGRGGLNSPQFICLGDVVNYGPQPVECLTWVKEHAHIAVQGNHDKAACASLRQPPYGIKPAYWPITLWTRCTLNSQHKEVMRSWHPEEKSPHGLRNFTLLHGSLTGGQDVYIRDLDDASRNLARLEQLSLRYALFGHSHHQGYFKQGVERVDMFLTSSEAPPSPRNPPWQAVLVPSEEQDDWQPLPGRWVQALFNPGSVGQPRRHSLLRQAGVAQDYRAAYMMLRLNGSGPGFFQFRRVAYDVETTKRQLREKVQWSADWTDDHCNDAGSSIHYAEPPAGPLDRELEETLANMGDRLSDLVENTLIPTLTATG